MNFLKERLAIERSHFQALGEGLQRMLLAYAFYLIADPLLQVFVNTFLWRKGGGILQISLYNFGWVVGLPIGFFFNGLLLRKIHIKYLYFFGVVLQGIGAALAIFSGILTPTSVAFYGILYGIASGFFWANRNSLDFRLSRGKNRGFYNHLYYAIDLMISVIMPAVIGWLIVAGEDFGWYTVDSAYRVLMILAIGLLAVGGYLIASFPMPAITPKKLFVTRPSRHWWRLRLFHLIFNLMWGVNFFLPAVLVLYFGSKEGILGTLRSISAILAAVAMYALGRKTQIKSTVRVVLWANVMYLLSALFLLWQFTWVGAAVYLIMVTIVSPIRWSPSYTVVMEIMDGEDGVIDGETDYAHVFDNEIFFNIGRSMSIVFFLVVMAFSLEGALKWVPVAVALSQFLMLPVLGGLVKQALNKKI